MRHIRFVLAWTTCTPLLVGLTHDNSNLKTGCTLPHVKLAPCGKDNISEVTAGHRTTFTCRTEGHLEWGVTLNNTQSPETLVACVNNVCGPSGLFPETFHANSNNTHQTLVINAVNNTELYNKIQAVNTTLHCTRKKGQDPAGSSSCGLNYVSPPENVSCNAINNVGSVNVSCVIGSVYASRKIYKCHLFRLFKGSLNEVLQTVDMVTSPTSEKIAKNEVKVSGSCQFITTLPSEGRNYGFNVSVTPGGRNYSVSLTIDREENEATTEKAQDRITREWDGRPTPQVYICNNGNNTAVWRSSSLTNYTFIAVCEGTAPRKCSASHQENVTSINASFGGQCGTGKLWMTSFAPEGGLTGVNESMELNFDIISYRVPRDYDVWHLVAAEDCRDVCEKESVSSTNVTCRADGKHRYLSRCSLTVYKIPSQTRSGCYRIRIVNNLGDVNFTLEIPIDNSRGDPRTDDAAVIWGAVGVVVFILTVTVLLVAHWRRKRRKGGKKSRTADANYESPWDSVPVTVGGLGGGWWTARAGVPVDAGRWTNQDGLVYVSPSLDHRKEHTPPVHEPTEYSTVKTIQNGFAVLDRGKYK